MQTGKHGTFYQLLIVVELVLVVELDNVQALTPWVGIDLIVCIQPIEQCIVERDVGLLVLDRIQEVSQSTLHGFQNRITLGDIGLIILGQIRREGLVGLGSPEACQSLVGSQSLEHSYTWTLRPDQA